MSDEKILLTGNTQPLKDEIKEKFKGARWSPEQRGWLIDTYFWDELVEFGKANGLSLDGKPAMNIMSQVPTAASAPQPAATTAPPSQPRAATTAPPPSQPRPASPTPPPQSKALVVVDYLDSNPGHAKPEIIHTHRGDMRVIARGIFLDSSNTHLIEGKRTPSAIAYGMIANAAGVKLVKPEFVEIYDPEKGENRKFPNPYLKLSPRGQIISATCRYVALGFTASGNLSVSDRTIYLNMASSLLYSLLKEINGKPAMGQTMSKAAYDERSENMQNWAYWTQLLGEDDYSTIVVAFDPSHEAVQKVFRGYAHLNEFAERHAQTKAATMALRNFPGVGIPDLQSRFAESGGQGVWIIVRSIGHKSDELDRLALKIQLGQTIDEKDVIIDAKYIDVSEEEPEPDDEALDAEEGDSDEANGNQG